MTMQTERAEWRLQFATATRDTLVTGNERCKPTGDGRWEHTVTLRFGEAFYRELAAKAARKGADNIRLSKRGAATVCGEWETVDCAPDVEAQIAARRADPEFTARLRETMDQNRRALERLADDEAPWCDCCSAGNHNTRCDGSCGIECCHPLYHQGYEVGYAAYKARAAAADASASEDAAYARLAAAQDDEDRGFHAAIRGRRRGGERAGEGD
jgi:hypothetical protein